jgi:chemotaxis protein MotB
MRFRNLTKPTDDGDAESTALLDVAWTSEDREDNWLISYADLLSVIFAMVVLLFGRMMTVSPPVAEAAELEIAAPPPGRMITVDGRAAAAAAAADMRAAEMRAAESRAAEPPTVESPAAESPAAESPSPEERLASLVEQRFRGQIETRRRERGIALAIPAVALFDSARAQLQDSAVPLLGELAATLREAGDARISVEGHTDDVPVQGGAFDSNWDLAAARANAVTRYLLAQGFAPARLQSVSYADTRPVSDNATAEGRAANRRVELQIEFTGDAG